VTHDQFLSQIRKQPAPVYLFLGPDGFYRDICRAALIERMLPREETGEGYVRHDLAEATVAAVIDDARSVNMFAPRRVIWASGAEAALPRGRSAAAEAVGDDGEKTEGKTAGAAEAISAYLRNPAPDTVVVFDSSRYEFDGEDKARSERVRKFFAPVSNVVEFPRVAPSEVRRIAQDVAKKKGLKIGSAELGLLVEATGGSAGLVATEIEKLALYSGPGETVTAADIRNLVPNAQSATIFALVGAVARNDRASSLELVDTLVRDGAYLPLALQFLASQLRQALVAREAGLRSAMQIQSHFQKLGVAMWPSRAEEILRTMTALPESQMRNALKKIADADRMLRDIRPDDKIIMEQFVMAFAG
jgi:DNA polymerase-3 subunit delta